LAWCAPDRRRAASEQAVAAAAAVRAAQALDEAWALLARLKLALPAAGPALLNEGDRIVSNLEAALQQRRAPLAQAAGSAP
jgi:hypothetical protein